jgi:AcrR family transcriptional regulator
VRAAIATLLPPDSKSLYPHMLAWTVLDGSASREFHASPAFQRVRALIEQERDAATPETDPRVLTATVMATILGWQFFKPFIWAAGELGDLDEAAASAQVIDLLTAMIRGAAAPSGDQPDRRA